MIWVNHKYNFDDIFNAMYTLFILSTFDGWSKILSVAVNAGSPTKVFIKKSLSSSYFLSY